MSNKKKCIIYANCQGNAVGHFLRKSTEFNDCYSVHFVSNYSLINSSEQIPIDLLKEADLFIYQPLNEKHGQYEPENLKRYTPSRCKSFSFPYIFNDALWPLVRGNGKVVGREAIDDLIEKGYSTREIVQQFLSLSIDFRFGERFEKSFSILKEKEAVADVKVTEYILANISKEKLFLTQNHPSSNLLLHCVNQLLSFLDFSPLSKGAITHLNEAGLPNCWPTSPYDKEYYNFQYSYGWAVFHEIKKDDNWKNYYLKLIGEILFEYSHDTKFRYLLDKLYIRYRRELAKLT